MVPLTWTRLLMHKTFKMRYWAFSKKIRQKTSAKRILIPRNKKIYRKMKKRCLRWIRPTWRRRMLFRRKIGWMWLMVISFYSRSPKRIYLSFLSIINSSYSNFSIMIVVKLRKIRNLNFSCVNSSATNKPIYHHPLNQRPRSRLLHSHQA